MGEVLKLSANRAFHGGLVQQRREACLGDIAGLIGCIPFNESSWRAVTEARRFLAVHVPAQSFDLQEYYRIGRLEPLQSFLRTARSSVGRKSADFDQIRAYIVNDTSALLEAMAPMVLSNRPLTDRIRSMYTSTLQERRSVAEAIFRSFAPAVTEEEMHRELCVRLDKTMAGSVTPAHWPQRVPQSCP